jgi:hypothetical protein
MVTAVALPVIDVPDGAFGTETKGAAMDVLEARGGKYNLSSIQCIMPCLAVKQAHGPTP